MNVERLSRLEITTAIFLLSLIPIDVMLRDGVLARVSFGFIAGVHAYAALLMFFSWGMHSLISRSWIRTVLFPFAYYAIHEGIFNFWFLLYYMRLPPFFLVDWWIEFLALDIAFSVFLLVFHKRFFEFSLLGVFCLVVLQMLMEVWINYGFPVTANIFGPSYNTLEANAFEVLYNVIFMLGFFLLYKK